MNDIYIERKVTFSNIVGISFRNKLIMSVEKVNFSVKLIYVPSASATTVMTHVVLCTFSVFFFGFEIDKFFDI